MNRIVKIVVLFFVFVVASGVVFWGAQWFSNSVGDMLLNHNDFLQSSLESSFASAEANIQPQPIISQNLLPLRDWEAPDAMVNAQSAMSVEVGVLTHKVLFKKNEAQKLPIASLTKLMTALAVLDHYDLNQQVFISQNAMDQEGEQGNLKLGQIWPVKDLLYITLMESSNRSAFALSEVMGTDNFIALMNDYAQKMGLENTHFQDSTGLDKASYSTVEDLLVLSEYLFKNYPLFREIAGLKEYDLYLPDGTFDHKIINTNQLLGEDNIVAGKTGFTKEARECFMVIQESPQKGNYIINIILGAEDRVLEMKNLINWVTMAYKFDLPIEQTL